MPWSGGLGETAVLEIQDAIGVCEGVRIVGGSEDTGATCRDLVDEPPHEVKAVQILMRRRLICE